MDKCYFGIASYKRADNQRTVEYLEKLGIAKERIILSVQTAEDKASYTAVGIDKRVGKLIYREGRNVSDNRNNLLDSIERGAKIVMLDDDIKSIGKLKGGKLEPIETAEELEEMIRRGFGLAAKHKTVGFGLYPVHNAYFMSESYAERQIVIGTAFAIINTDLRFDREMRTKEDYEYCCKAIRRYGAFVRLNNYACNAQHYSKGGCADEWKNEAEVRRTARRLAGKYPDIVKLNARKAGEIKMVKARAKK